MNGRQREELPFGATFVDAVIALGLVGYLVIVCVFPELLP